MPIRWKLILAIGLPLLVLMSALLVLDYLRLRRTAIEQNSQRITEIALRHAAVYKGIFDATAQVARMGAAFVGTHEDLTEGELYELLREHVERNRLVYGSCLAFEPGAFALRGKGMPPSGMKPAVRENTLAAPGLFAPYVYRGPGGLEWLDIADVYDYTKPEWEWYARVRTEPKELWTDPYFDKDAGNVPMVTFSAPLSRQGKFIGVATVDIQLERLRRDSLVDRSPATSVYIIDRQGRFILAPDGAAILHRTIFDTADDMSSPDLADVGRRALRGEQGTGSFRDKITGEKFLVYFAPIEGTSWALGCVSPENYFLGEQMASLRTRMAIGAGIVGAILGLVALMGSWIVRPVGKLAAAVKSVGSGDLSAVVETRSKDEIGQLARGFNTMMGELREHVDALTKATAARQAVESELTIARSIQASLLPRVFPKRREIELFAASSPARHVGGDFFDFFFVNDHTLAVVVADVSGKGVPAAIFMAVARTMVRDLASSGRRSPAEVLDHANEALSRENSEGMFVTVFMGQYDMRTGAFRYACAGHPPAYLVTAKGKVHRATESTGTVLGVFTDQRFVERTVVLVPGDKLVLYTDGVPEARSASGEFYRAERFEELLATLAGRGVRELCDAAMGDVDKFQGGEAHDDVTLLVLGRTV